MDSRYTTADRSQRPLFEEEHGEILQTLIDLGGHCVKKEHEILQVLHMPIYNVTFQWCLPRFLKENMS